MASSLPSEQLSGQQAQTLPHQHHQLQSILHAVQQASPKDKQEANPEAKAKAEAEAGTEAEQHTPHQQRTRLTTHSTPKSAPPKCQTQLRLTSPEAARRSRQSLEAIHVARTLKDGLNRLKERADPQHLLSGGTSRPLRTYSATSTPVQRRRSNQLVRHHSSFQNSLEQQRTTINSVCFVDGGRREPPPRFALDSPGEWRPRRAAEAAETMILFKSQSQSSGMSVDLSEDVSPSPEALGRRGGLPASASASASASVYESATAVGAGSGSGRVMLEPNVGADSMVGLDPYETEEDELLSLPNKRVRAESASRPTKRASLDR